MSLLLLSFKTSAINTNNIFSEIKSYYLRMSMSSKFFLNYTTSANPTPLKYQELLIKHFVRFNRTDN